MSKYTVHIWPAPWKEIKYAITEKDKTVDVLAIRKRPPYDYKDLKQLLRDFLAREATDNGADK